MWHLFLGTYSWQAPHLFLHLFLSAATIPGTYSRENSCGTYSCQLDLHDALKTIKHYEIIQQFVKNHEYGTYSWHLFLHKL